MQRRASEWPWPRELVDHETWRPDWRSGIECLYWYLTFDHGALSDVLDGELGALVGSAPWLDPVPLEWMHLTLCEVGFIEETAPAVQDVVASVRAATADQPVLSLRLGPALTFPRALALAAGPLEDLRVLQERVRGATARALGPTVGVDAPRTFWPHVSVGYVNREVSAVELDEVRAQLPELDLPDVQVHSIALVSVLRQGRSYRWSVLARVPLGSPAP